MKVISFSNARGGCAKTTCNLEVATVMQNKGYRVLVIDLDMQGSLSKCCGAELNDNNIFTVLTAQCSLTEAIQTTPLFDIIPASSKLSEAEKIFTDVDEDKFLLLDVLNFLKDKYDFVFIDTAPARNILHKMTFVAANYIVIPTRNDSSGLDATITQQNEIDQLKHSRTKAYNCKIIGYVLSEYDNTLLSSAAYDQLCEYASLENAFVSVISHAVKVAEVKSYKNAVSKKYKGSKSGREFYTLADQILLKIGEDENGSK